MIANTYDELTFTVVCEVLCFCLDIFGFITVIL